MVWPADIIVGKKKEKNVGISKNNRHARFFIFCVVKDSGARVIGYESTKIIS